MRKATISRRRDVVVASRIPCSFLGPCKRKAPHHLSAGQKKRIARIITLTELNHAENRREVIGKSIKEVERDYNDFSEMALKAENILKQTRPNLLERFLNRIGMRTAK